jgi:hypothetical protein
MSTATGAEPAPVTSGVVRTCRHRTFGPATAGRGLSPRAPEPAHGGVSVHRPGKESAP